jgi:predicted DNA-binding ribbon-helix-helix protein
MKSSIAKRSVVIAGHKTSVSLEDRFLGLRARDR